MTTALWIAIVGQVLMGAFDTFFHHEATERLAWRPSQVVELRLHGLRNLAYGAMFLILGWMRLSGAPAILLLVLMTCELGITLWDFVEEDRTRHLPASERITHTLLALNFGAILAWIVPLLLAGIRLPAAPAFHGLVSWFCLLAALIVAIFGLRDLAAARRCRRLGPSDPAALAAALGPIPQSILVTGGTGFIGRRLVAALVAAGHEVTVLTRRSGAEPPMPIRMITHLDQLGNHTGIDVIVNLAGEPIATGLWTLARRRRILASRLRITRQLTKLIARLDRKPALLISGSAIGWYGIRRDERLDEHARGRPCFSRTLCLAWEEAARVAESMGVRTVRLRIGLVLGTDGGMLGRMLMPFEFGLGGRFGNGQQWMSWIHRDDLVRLIVHCMATPALHGPVNAVAPIPVRNAEFTRMLARALRRPAWIPIPALPLHLLLRDMADELLLGGQCVIPTAALESGFVYRFPKLDAALQDLMGAAGKPRLARPKSANAATPRRSRLPEPVAPY